MIHDRTTGDEGSATTGAAQTDWPAPPWADQVPPALPGWTPSTAEHFGAVFFPHDGAHDAAPSQDRRRLKLRWMMAAIVTVAMGAGIGIGALVAKKATTAIAQTKFSSVMKASDNALWFHYAEYSTTGGNLDNIIGTAGPTSGVQLITQAGASGTDIFTLHLANGIVYFNGNQAAVLDQLDVLAATATVVAGKWISLSSSDAPYRDFEVGITSKSNLSQIPATFRALGVGRSATGVDSLVGAIPSSKSHTSGSGTLRYHHSTSLLVSLNEHASLTGGTIVLDWQFLRWGKHFSVLAPSGSVPYSSLKLSAATSTG